MSRPIQAKGKSNGYSLEMVWDTNPLIALAGYQGLISVFQPWWIGPVNRLLAKPVNFFILGHENLMDPKEKM